MQEFEHWTSTVSYGTVSSQEFEKRLVLISSLREVLKEFQLDNFM
jgi:hypothetical protein